MQSRSRVVALPSMAAPTSAPPWARFFALPSMAAPTSVPPWARVLFLVVLFPTMSLWSQTIAAARFDGLDEALLPKKIAEETFSYLGTPYVSAGVDKSGVDCSGLVYAVFREAAKKELPRMVDALFSSGQEAGGVLRIGDLVFFDTASESPDPAIPVPPTHVGIYIGGGRFVHAASEGAQIGVKVSSFQERYYSSRYVGARRVLPWAVPVLELATGAKQEAVALTEALPSGAPLKVDVASARSEPLVLSVFRDGTPILTRRIPAGGTESPILAMTTEPGEWTVTLSTPRDEAVLAVAFQVKE